jgi:hypothetical protein
MAVTTRCWYILRRNKEEKHRRLDKPECASAKHGQYNGVHAPTNHLLERPRRPVNRRIRRLQLAKKFSAKNVNSHTGDTHSIARILHLLALPDEAA